MKNFVKKTAATALSVLGILSAMPSAFCTPDGNNNERGHIDPFNIMVVGKYLDSVGDLQNLQMANKKYENLLNRYHFNPVGNTSKEQLDLYPNMETYRIEKNFVSTFPDKKIMRLVYLPGSFNVNRFEEVVYMNKLFHADEWNREFALESENPMDGCQLIFTNKTTDKEIVFKFNPYVGGVLTSLIGYNSLLKECGIVGEELTAASVAPSGVFSIPESVESIGNDAFKGCKNLTEVIIPSSVKIIRDKAFEGCTGLTQVTIPESVESIGENAFKGCTGLTQVNIPNSVESIGYGAFKGCMGLTQVIIPSSVKIIRDKAFKGCTGLTQVTIPESVESIGENAFEGCTGLTEITIPNSVTNIDKDAFWGCNNLNHIEYKGKVYTDKDSFSKAIDDANKGSGFCVIC